MSFSYPGLLNIRNFLVGLQIVVLEKTLEVPLTARRSNQSLLKEINPEYLLEGLKLKLQYSGHLMPRTNSLEKTLMMGKIEGQRRRRQQRIRWLDSVTDSMSMNLSKLPGTAEPGGLPPMGSHRVRHDLRDAAIYLMPRAVPLTIST